MANRRYSDAITDERTHEELTFNNFYISRLFSQLLRLIHLQSHCYYKHYVTSKQEHRVETYPLIEYLATLPFVSSTESPELYEETFMSSTFGKTGIRKRSCESRTHGEVARTAQNHPHLASSVT